MILWTSTTRGVRLRPQIRPIALVVLALTAVTAACSQGAATKTSPSAVPSDLAAGSSNVTLPAPVITADTSVCGQATLSWTNVPVSGNSADRWHVQVSDTSNFSNILFNDAKYPTTSLLQVLAPGTYWIRVNATSTDPHVLNSGFVILQFTVSACVNGCTFSQGYWKNHPAAWPVSTLTLGSVSYTAAQLQSILGTPVGGNGLISLAYQLIAAKLNIANGADGTAVSGTLSSADVMIGGLIVPPVGSGVLAPGSTGALTATLDGYNNGLIGPGSCETPAQ